MATRRVIVNTPKAASAVGPYSQAVLIGQTMYISGTMGIDPNSNSLVTGGIREQTKMALTNIENILESVGASINNMVKVTVLLTDITEFDAVNEVYQTYFVKNHPARAAYQVSSLPKGAQVEIEGVAVLGDLEDYEMF